MSSAQWLLIIFGAAIGAWLSHLMTWKQARKIEDLVSGGLRSWDDYDAAQEQAKGQTKNVIGGRFQ